MRILETYAVHAYSETGRYWHFVGSWFDFGLETCRVSQKRGAGLLGLHQSHHCDDLVQPIHLQHLHPCPGLDAQCRTLVGDLIAGNCVEPLLSVPWLHSLKDRTYQSPLSLLIIHLPPPGKVVGVSARGV